ncbi:reverse transcriptase domain-containing protein [Tanacetum coccineum]
MKESVSRDLPPTSFLGHLKEQMGSLYRTCEVVCMIGNPKEVHKVKFLASLPGTNDDHWDKLKETDDEKDLEAHYTNAKPLGKALTQKEKDPRSFTLPYFINNMCYKAVADLGESVSVMPYSTYTTLGLGNLITTKLIVELADRTVKRPKGIVENMLVSIDKFTFSVYFIILDIPEDFKTP